MGGEKSLCVCFNCESASFEIVSRAGGVFQERENVCSFMRVYTGGLFSVCFIVVFVSELYF